MKYYVYSFLLLCLSPALFAQPQFKWQGIDSEQEENIQSYLSLSKLTCKTPLWRVKHTLKQAVPEITEALQALGYYHSQITALALEETPDCWAIKGEIQIGVVMRWTHIKVRIEGKAKTDTAFDDLEKTLAIKFGEAVNHAKYENAKKSLLSLAAERGYFEAKLIKKVLRINIDKKTAEAYFTLQSGARYRFNSFTIHSQYLEKDFIRRLMKEPEEPYYSNQKLHILYKSLNDSNYFESIYLKKTLNNDKKQVDIDIELTDKKRHQFSIGAGFASDTGARIKLKYKNRRINRWGHHFSSNMMLSTIGGALDAHYILPYGDSSQETLSFHTGLKTEDSSSNKHTNYQIGFRLSELCGAYCLQTRSLLLQREEYEIANETKTATLLVPSIQWLYHKKDDKQPSLNSQRLNLAIHVAPHPIQGSTRFAQISFDGQWIRPAPTGRWLQHFALGATWSDDFNELPVSYRFFAGGDQSIRGYAYESLGSENEQGYIIGGSYLLLGSVEYEYPLWGKWAVAGFVDTGNAFQTWDDNFKTGIGIGVRWYSPIGSIRLDFAHPLDDPDTVLRVHISLGI